MRTRDADGQTDGQLLGAFLGQRDEAAFAALVERHGPMVLGVCRRLLGCEADAEDAFQATFLVLVRRAASLRGRPVLGAWLHGVARRTALNARRLAARRRQKEQALARPEATAGEVRDDGLSLLDQELGRLPEKYRLPVLLCDLEGRPRREAARRLGWPEGTVAGRLARGRALLARRLARQGLAPSAVALAAGAARAGVPPALATSTVKAAGLLAAGRAVTTVVSATVIPLTDRVVNAMFLGKVKGLFMATVILVAAVALAWGMAAAGPPARKGGDGPAPEKAAGEHPLRKAGGSERQGRAAAPEAAEDWSQAVGGLQARLTVERKGPFNGTPTLTAYLTLRNASDQAGIKEVPWDRAELAFTVTDAAGKVVPAKSGPYDEARGPVGVLRLPPDSELRLNITHRGAGVPRDQGGFLDLGVGSQWAFRPGDRPAYYLQATLTVRPSDGGLWSGTIQVPRARIPPSKAGD
jgi:RNA polymerase sigma factor (sigma-70 family)